MSSDGLTVLVVEDAEDTRDYFAATLEEAGYRVLCAESVREGLSVLRSRRRIDAVIVDYLLGDGTGTEMIHQAANEGHLDVRTVPALICTVYRYVELPPYVAFVRKPVEPNQLVREIESALGRKSFIRTKGAPPAALTRSGRGRSR